MNQALTLGISPCPNDTFMFHDLGIDAREAQILGDVE